MSIPSSLRTSATPFVRAASSSSLTRRGAQEDDRGIRGTVTNLVRSSRAVDVRKPVVDHDDVGSQLGGGGCCGAAHRNRPDDLDSGGAAEQEYERVAIDVRVLHEQHTDRAGPGHSATTRSG